MTEEEILDLEVEKELYKEILRGLNIKLSSARHTLKELESRWGEVEKEYERLDRLIAMETKRIFLPSKVAAPKKEISASEAATLLALLEANIKPLKKEEDPTDLIDEVEEILFEEEED